MNQIIYNKNLLVPIMFMGLIGMALLILIPAIIVYDLIVLGPEEERGIGKEWKNRR